MNIKKLSAVSLSAIMATTMMVPFSAMADQQPSVEYTGGNGDPITHLYLIADDSNLANNRDADWNKTNAKVEVPVAIHYVAQADGTIVGPNDEAAQIRNFAGFPVNVSNILVTAGTNVTLVNSAEAADTADEIYLQMKPNSGTVLALADYTASATESAVGENDGTGARPAAGAEWNIAAAVSGVGTSSAQASVLNLNALSGKIGGFNQLNPAAEQEIGQINWTIKAGTYVNPVDNSHELPTAATFASTSLQRFHNIGEYLVGEGKTDSDYLAAAEALVGQTMDVALNEGQGSMTVQLVDVDNSRGLTFEAVNILTRAVMNNSATNTGGWAVSDLQASMNGGEIYTTYFSTSALNGFVRRVSNTSHNYDNSLNTSSDYYWLPSGNNIFGAGWFGVASNDDGDARFDYYTAHNAKSDYIKSEIGNPSGHWWLRSAHSTRTDHFLAVLDTGNQGGLTANTSTVGVAPCFCL